MKIQTLIPLAAVLLFLQPFHSRGATGTAPAAGEKTQSLFDTSASGVEKRFEPTSGQVTVSHSSDPAAPGVVVTIQPGAEGYPGVNFKPEGSETWDLSQFGHINARIVNTGTKALSFAIRVDNKGDWRDSPWNTENVTINPGASNVISVIFGYTYGHKKGYALKPSEIINILIFASKSATEQSFRIESLEAGGPAGEKPPVDPKTVRVKPTKGEVFGSGVAFDVTKQVDVAGGAQAAMDGDALKITFAGGKPNQSGVLKTAMGRWDLREAVEVKVKLKNTGSTPITPSVQVASNGGPTDNVSAKAALAPGASEEIVVPFAASVAWKGTEPTGDHGNYEGEKGTGTKFTSDAAGPIRISSKEGNGSLLVESIVADTPIAVLPAWVGKRPPVEGDWVKTFDEEFDGKEFDQKKWNIYGPNFWDKKTHWSKDNMILSNGVAIQRFEKKRGFHNDDPNAGKETDYACGYLDTYGKWVQRYGYFEARVKLPDAPGLWPTFWLMPDRGAAAGPQWKRQDTGGHGMEFDIMEHLTRWGLHRYNIADHWDGYGKNHKANGSTCNYVEPDKDGFITCGLLWTPGSVTYYCNGKEMVTWQNARISDVQANIIIETTTGGWDNDSVDDSTLPVDYQIDYVRVWQRKDLASGVDGYQKPAPAEAAKPVQ